MTFIKKIPIPMGGLILAIISLANYFLQQGAKDVGTLLAWFAIVLLLLLSCRIILDFRQILIDMNNPMIASVAPTYTMSIFGIATFLHQFETITGFATTLWYFGVILHVALMVYFAFRFVFTRQLTINSLYPSWFITFIGIGVITFTSPIFNDVIGTIFFYIAIINYSILLPLILYRVIKTAYDEKPHFPLLTILTAPTSLCLAGYITITDEHSTTIVAIAFVISQALYLVALYFLSNLWKLQFYPSFAAFTFPLVITAIAAHLANSVLKLPFLDFLVLFELTIASLVTLIVTIRYAFFIFTKE